MANLNNAKTIDMETLNGMPNTMMRNDENNLKCKQEAFLNNCEGMQCNLLPTQR